MQKKHNNLYYIFEEDKALHPMLIESAESIREKINALFEKR
jgi:hypothetical protein